MSQTPKNRISKVALPVKGFLQFVCYQTPNSRKMFLGKIFSPQTKRALNFDIRPFVGDEEVIRINIRYELMLLFIPYVCRGRPHLSEGYRYLMCTTYV